MTIDTLLTSDEVFQPFCELLKLDGTNVCELTAKLAVGEKVVVVIKQNEAFDRVGPFVEQKTLDVDSNDICLKIFDLLNVKHELFIDATISLVHTEPVLIQYTRYITK